MKLENRKNEHRLEKPYSWKTKIPKRWQLVPNRGLFTERNIKNCPDYQPLTVTIKSGVSRQADYLETSTKKDSSNENKDNYKLVKPGDLAYNKMRMWQGAVGVSNYEGIVSPAYIVIRPKVNLVSKFFHYLFRTKEYTVESYRHSYGISSDQLSLRFEDFKTILTPLPPLQEQQAIVRFLDHKLSKIDEYIRKKERMIELLKEQKTSLINEAVTQGLDPDVPKKDSGIERLGEIPEHWKIKALKYLAKTNRNSLPENTDPDYEIEYLDISSIGTGEIIKAPKRYRFKDAPSRARFKISSGDTLISTVRTYLKSVCYISESKENLIGSTGFAVLTPKQEVVPEFLGLACAGDYFTERVSANSVGASFPAIAPSKLIAMKIAFPPTIEEQKEIIDSINFNSIRINHSIKLVQKQIDKIKEYRQSLISEAVTGKIDCREYMPEQTANADV